MSRSSANRSDLEVINELLDGDDPLVVSLDIDNPVKEPGPHMEPRPGVLEGIDRLIDLADAVAFNSGKPLDYQRELRSRYTGRQSSISELDLIGGMGTVAEIDGKTYHFGSGKEESLPDFLDVQQNIVSVLAENGWKANMQNNRSYDVGVTRVEAENGEPHSRGHSKANPLFSDIGTVDLYSRYFEDAEGFRLLENYERDYSPGEGAVEIQVAPDTISYLAEVARVEEPFVGLRFEENDESVVFYRDSADRNVEDQEVRSELESAVREAGADWRLAHHDDGGTEYWKDGIGKEQGLERYLDIKFVEDANAVHIGDSSSDWIDTERVTTIPQYGTELYEERCPDHGIEPENVADFSDMMARAENRGA